LLGQIFEYKKNSLLYTSTHAPSMSNTQKTLCCNPTSASQAFAFQQLTIINYRM
jgi:hypothetical protein